MTSLWECPTCGARMFREVGEPMRKKLERHYKTKRHRRARQQPPTEDS